MAPPTIDGAESQKVESRSQKVEAKAESKSQKGESKSQKAEPVSRSVTFTENGDGHGDDPGLQLVWMLEEAPSNPSTQVLTVAGLDRIAHHKYVAGGYTWLDNLLNPMWTALTEFLPFRMAPNLVTLCGAFHGMLCYVWTWIAAPEAVEAVPPYLLVANAYCLFTAYTLDCMDGKQARRTGNSSPLGQLLDHGLDGLCVLAHVAAVHAWLRAGDTLQLQVVLQLSFYMAQWEEFYTGILPHATGPIGVTEVNYGMALVSLLHGTVWRAACTNPESGMYDGYVIDDVGRLMKQGYVSHRLVDVVLNTLIPEEGTSMTKLSTLLEGLRRRDVLLASWCCTMLFFCCLSVGRVWFSLKTYKHRLAAVLQLATPVALVLLALVDEYDENFDGNEVAIRTTIRWKSLAIGFLYCLLTTKVIVFSMARQAIAVIQWDALPLVAAILLTVYDPRLYAPGHILVWQILAIFWGWRLCSWSSTAVGQISRRLQIYVWTVDPREF
jgi:ethanolaminephosphotransferase